MNDQSKMSYQPTLTGLLDAISSQELQSGTTPSINQDLPDVSGPAPALASLSARQAKERGLMTSGTYGLRGSTLSKSADLTQSLANRFRARTEQLGSTLFTLTWKESTTASGRLIFRLRASAPRTAGKDFSGWPTPQKNDDNMSRRSSESMERWMARPDAGSELAATATLASWPTPQAGTPAQNGNNEAGNNLGQGMHGVSLTHAVHLATWTTPQAHDAAAHGKGQKAKHGTKHGCADLNADAQLATWATPSVRDHKDTPGMSETGINPDGSERSRLDQLPRQAFLTNWVPPRATDGSKGGPNQAGSKGDLMLPSQASLTASGTRPNGSTAATKNTGQLNPAFSLWLMGLPGAWACCGERAMRSFRKRRKRS